MGQAAAEGGRSKGLGGKLAARVFACFSPKRVSNLVLEVSNQSPSRRQAVRNMNIVRAVDESVGALDRNQQEQITEMLAYGSYIGLIADLDFELEGPWTGTALFARRLRDRARRRGLKQFSRTYVSDKPTVLEVQWYRQTRGDLLPPELRSQRKTGEGIA
jgi:hypothetical protein